MELSAFSEEDLFAYCEAIRRLGMAAEYAFDRTDTFFQGWRDETLGYDPLNSQFGILTEVNTNYRQHNSTNPLTALPDDWDAVSATCSPHGLETVIFESNLTNQLIIFAIGQQGDTTATHDEYVLDAVFSTNPALTDRVPLTAFELVQLYEQYKNDPQYSNYDIILAGHSLGAHVAKVAGALLQVQGENINVVSYGGIGASSLLNNIGAQDIDQSNFINFLNSGDGKILQDSGWVYNFGTTYYAPAIDLSPASALGLNDTNHALLNLGDLRYTATQAFHYYTENGFDRDPFLIPVIVRVRGSYHSPEGIAGNRRIPASGELQGCCIA